MGGGGLGFFVLFFLLFLLPGFDVLGGYFATAFALAGILKFAAVIATLAASDALAIVLPGAVMRLGGFFERGHFSRDGISGVATPFRESRAGDQSCHCGGHDQCSGCLFHKLR